MAPDWHLDAAELERYGQGLLQGPTLWSAEAHLVACPACRDLLAISTTTATASSTATATAAAAIDQIWQRLDTELDCPRPGVVEWVLLRVGVPEHLARLLAATPTLRLSWLAAVSVTFGLGVGADWLSRSVSASLILLALVPLIAVAGVAAAFGPQVDPTYEIGLVAPFDTFRLMLLRASAVLTMTVLLAGVAAVAAPDMGLRTAAWLAPALLLTGLSLALSSMLGPISAATVAGGSWLLVLVTTSWLPAGSSLLFDPPAQTTMAVAAVLAAIAVTATRWRFDTSRTFDASRRLHQ
jgi:hypothetical protein